MCIRDRAFAAQMTERARALGLENSTFANASGWPDPGQRMSMKDLGLLSVRLIEPVSYTHLDVYKRQIWRCPSGVASRVSGVKQITPPGTRASASRRGRSSACLLYTSRCV